MGANQFSAFGFIVIGFQSQSVHIYHIFLIRIRAHFEIVHYDTTNSPAQETRPKPKILCCMYDLEETFYLPGINEGTEYLLKNFDKIEKSLLLEEVIISSLGIGGT